MQFVLCCHDFIASGTQANQIEASPGHICSLCCSSLPEGRIRSIYCSEGKLLQRNEAVEMSSRNPDESLELLEGNKGNIHRNEMQGLKRLPKTPI